jgi:hypothetical protein
MTHRDPDDHAAVVALLERKLDAISPRDADPVRSVVRRARARRRRVLATACAAVLVVAGVVGGALATGQGTATFRTTPTEGGTPTGSPSDGGTPTSAVDAAGNVRATQPWSGEVVAFHGLVLPVPHGWTVRRSSDPGETCLGAAPKTLWLMEVPDGVQFDGGCHRDGVGDGQVWVVATPLVVYTNAGSNPLAMDPSGQPVWQPDLPWFEGLALPWLHVWLDTYGLSDDERASFLGAVRAEPVTPHPGLTLSASATNASYQRFGGPSGHGNLVLAAVRDVLATARPDDTLRCVPRQGALIGLTGSRVFESTTVAFDTTGACNQITDFDGGLATLGPDALRTLAAMVHAPGAD